MSEITIKQPKLTVEVFNKEGSSMGTFSGAEAINVVTYLKNGIKSFLTATNDAGETQMINPDCICSAKTSMKTEEIKFDDMSVPFGCCGETTTTTTTSSTTTSTTTTTTTTTEKPTTTTTTTTKQKK